MTDTWLNIAIEIGLFSLLGVLYYFYQKRKIIGYEENKKPALMGYLIQACLAEKNEQPEEELDRVIEALDDFLHGKSDQPPIALLKIFSASEKCSPELKEVIKATLEELGE
jgi:hypothetical protein